MRMTYTRVPFDFERAETIEQVPMRIVMHRQGNPGAEGENGLAWGKRTGAFTIHGYVDDEVCFDAIPPTRHAFHVLASRLAHQSGFKANGVYGWRGDYETIGIECEDESPESGDLAPGQAYGLSQATRITALLRVRDYLLEFPHLTPDDVYEHADFDKVTRAHDLGDALNMADFRDDLRDLLAGRAPWRTVQRHATGARAPLTWKPAEKVPAPNVYTVRPGDTLGAIASRYSVAVSDLARWNGIADPNRIEVGQVLRLTAGAPAAFPPPPAWASLHDPLDADDLIDVVLLAGYRAPGAGSLAAAKVVPTRDTEDGHEVHRLLVKRAA